MRLREGLDIKLEPWVSLTPLGPPAMDLRSLAEPQIRAPRRDWPHVRAGAIRVVVRHLEPGSEDGDPDDEQQQVEHERGISLIAR
jgi:hypothetical protein